VEFAVEGKSLTVWAAQQHLSVPKFIFLAFGFRKPASPRFLSGRSGTESFTGLSVSVSYSRLLLLPFAKFINCIFYKVLLFNTIVTACFFQLLLLNCYIKHSGYFGSFLAAYCVTLIQGPLLSGPIVGLKGQAYKWKQSVVVYVVPASL
jgi:hypothetical protein